MFVVICDNKEKVFSSLDSAMKYAKTLDGFIKIRGGDFEAVGKFGVDSIKEGKCPDGVDYDWNKASRIGRVQKERTT